jgi:hypothetical protein
MTKPTMTLFTTISAAWNMVHGDKSYCTDFCWPRAGNDAARSIVSRTTGARRPQHPVTPINCRQPAVSCAREQ